MPAATGRTIRSVRTPIFRSRKNDNVFATMRNASQLFETGAAFNGLQVIMTENES